MDRCPECGVRLDRRPADHRLPAPRVPHMSWCLTAYPDGLEVENLKRAYINGSMTLEEFEHAVEPLLRPGM